MTPTPPDTLIVGMLADSHAVEVFNDDEAAVDWVERHRQSPARRRVHLWRVRLVDPVPLTIVPPTPARLIPEGDR